MMLLWANPLPPPKPRVGSSEENVRSLFADAEADWKKNGEGADLHVLIFDEIDALCRARGGGGGGGASAGSSVGDSVVNQLLTKSACRRTAVETDSTCSFLWFSFCFPNLLG